MTKALRPGRAGATAWLAVVSVMAVGCGDADESQAATEGTGGAASGTGASSSDSSGSGASSGSAQGGSGAAGGSTSSASSGTGGAAPCDQTLNPGDDVVGAVASAPAGSTICLADGDYGTVELFDISRSDFVTLRSDSGTGATMNPEVGNSSFIRFQNMTIAGSLVNNCSTHIHFLGSPFSEGLLITNHGYDCPSGNQDYLVDGATFSGLGGATYEGRLSVVAADGAVIKNSFFGDGGVSDGIQLLGDTKNSVIGPGNVFDGIRQSICDAGGGAHCDAIQPYGSGANNVIAGNHFRNCDTFIMSPDGDTATVTDNVFDGAGVSYLDKIQFGSAASPVFRHNTVRDVRVSFDSKTGESATSNALAEDNIMIGESSWKTSNGSGCSGCSFSSNLFDDGGDASGSGNVIGTPVFVGGPDPASWPGWELAGGSPGKGDASDGMDMGVTSFGP